MNKNESRLAWLLAVVTTLALLASACGSDDGDDAGSDDNTSSTAAPTGTESNADTTLLEAATAKLTGQGSSFQDTFQQQVSSDFAKAVKDAGGSAAVTYTKTGSSDGKKALADETVDFAGTDSLIKDDEKAAFGNRKILYFPIIGGPIGLAINIEGVDTLNLDADTIAKIFQAEITTWDDAAIADLNPDADLPSTKIAVVRRSDGSGTTNNFTKYLVAAAPDTWKLDSGDTVNWAASTQGAEKSTGVISVVKQTKGAIGYADLADVAKENLDVVSVKDAAGEFVPPTPDGASKALESAEIADDLTFDPINAQGEGAYPITSPTWVVVDAGMSGDAAATMKAYLSFMLTDGQAQAKALFYAPLPTSLADKAIAQIDQIGG